MLKAENLRGERKNLRSTGRMSAERSHFSNAMRRALIVVAAVSLLAVLLALGARPPMAAARQFLPSSMPSRVARADQQVDEKRLALAMVENNSSELHHGLDLREEFLNFDTVEDGSFTLNTKEGLQLTYTVLPWLQQQVERYIHRYRSRLSYAVVVALEPASGRVLAMVQYNRRKRPQRHHLALQASYPAASLFKIVTLAAALEANDSLDADSRFYYRGSQYRISRRELDQNPRYLPKRISLSRAFAKSNNAVFGALAFRYVGTYLLQKYAQAFGFNRSLKFDYPVEDSRVSVASNPLDLARIGAGLWRQTTISPLHAALLAAAIGNNGVMMAPYIVNSVRDRDDKVIYRAGVEAIGHPISGETAQDIRDMMFETVENGTLRAAFNRGGKPALPVKLGGKTGTLRGNDPNGRYNWFVGLAPLNEPKIAVAAMVVNARSWRVKARQVGKALLQTYFARSAALNVSKGKTATR